MCVTEKKESLVCKSSSKEVILSHTGRDFLIGLHTAYKQIIIACEESFGSIKIYGKKMAQCSKNQYRWVKRKESNFERHIWNEYITNWWPQAAFAVN